MFCAISTGFGGSVYSEIPHTAVVTLRAATEAIDYSAAPPRPECRKWGGYCKPGYTTLFGINKFLTMSIKKIPKPY